MQKFSRSFLLKILDLSGAKVCKSFRSRKMLQNAPTLATVAVHTDENEPSRVQVKSNEITCTYYLMPRFPFWATIWLQFAYHLSTNY